MKIPVIILSGFLGSGKTTLLLTLLKESKARGLNPGVVMNELGKRDVDGYILQEHTGTSVEKLLDGCVCCSRKDELPGSLNALLARRPDMIFIELTGVADPEEIAKSLLEPSFSERLALHYTVTLLDAENMLEYNSRFSADKQLVRTLHKQISGADLIIVNKSDLVEPETLWKIERPSASIMRNPRLCLPTTVKSTWLRCWPASLPGHPVPQLPSAAPAASTGPCLSG